MTPLNNKVNTFKNCISIVTLTDGEGNGNPLQYSCLGNPMEEEPCQAMVHGVAESQIQVKPLKHAL